MLSQIHSHVLDAVSRAPSAHNTQPWALSLGSDELCIGLKHSRALPAIDPAHVEMLHALGAALENVLLTLDFCGCEARYEVVGSGLFEGPVVLVRWKQRNAAVVKGELYRMIPIRRTSRLPYESMPVPAVIISESKKLTNPDCDLYVTTENDRLFDIRNLVALATVQQMGDDAVVDELRRWIRFSKKDPRWYRDGLNAECMGWGMLESAVTSGVLSRRTLKLIRMLNADRLIFGSVNSVAPASPAICLLTVTSDDAGMRIEAGRVLQRIWLFLTSKGLATHPISAAVDVENTRKETMKILGVPSGQKHVNLFRMGYSKPVARSPRIPMDELLVGYE